MDKFDGLSAPICNLCGDAFMVPEDKADGNLPRMLLCSHIFCTNCLLSIQSDGTIRCPECEIESTLPEGGVYGLQEDSRIIGLIYTTKMNQMRSYRVHGPRGRRKNRLSLHVVSEVVEQPADITKIERTIDESLVQAAENLIQLENIYKTLTAGLEQQVIRERTRLEMEIMQVSNKAIHTIQKWKDTQLNQLTQMETKFPSSQAAVSLVQERIKALEIAMRKAREVRRVPFLEQYCILDKVLETLNTPVDHTAFDLKFLTQGTGLSCVFQSECVGQCWTLSLKMEPGCPLSVSESPLANHQSDVAIKTSSLEHVEDRSSCSSLPSNKLPTHEKQEPEIPAAGSSSPPALHSQPKPGNKKCLSRHSSLSDLESPDVIIEELFDDTPVTVTPTGPEMANNEWRSRRRPKHHLHDKKGKKVTRWVVVTHVVNPSHFYVRYVAEKKEFKILSKKINKLCSGEGCCFTPRDTVDRGSMIFVKWKDGQWCRTRVVEVFQKSCVNAVKACPITQLASLRVFFPDYGFTKSITIHHEDGTTEALLNTVNNHLRKVSESVKVELSCLAPQAIRCSLKDLVPYDLTEGWSEEAKAEFCSMVGSAAVEMRLLGQDKDSLLVDLRKAPMEQSIDVPMSVGEYLVFSEVARFYTPVTLGRKPLMYYPPVFTETSTELDAVVCHINNLSDFYIQLVDNMESLLLSAKLQDCYNELTEDTFRVYCPAIGQACVARSEDNLWYRAQVIGHYGRGKVEVRYVDFGNKQILSVSELRKIKDEFFALPAMALRCCLADVIPLEGDSWSEACTKRFISLAHQQLVSVVAAEGEVPKNEPLPLGMFIGGVNQPKTSIAELLVKEDLARFKHDRLAFKNEKSPGVAPPVWDPPLELGSAVAPDQVTVVEESNEPPELQTQLKLPDQRKDLKVRVTHVISPSSFYVRLTDSDPQLKRICELVKQECALMEPQDVVWEADMYCAANINGVWERGQICCDVTSNNMAEVRRCDHGNTVKIHVSNLYPLPTSLIGSLALECTLNDIRPTGGRSTWTDTACDLISYYLNGASALMTIKEVTDEQPLPVVLFCSNKMGEYISIADFLVNEGLAFRERKERVAVVEKPSETDSQTPASDPETCKKEESNSLPSTPVFACPASSVIPKSTCIPPKPLPRSKITAEKVKTSMYHPPELPCLGHILITVSAVGDDGVIYARTQNAEYQLEQLKEGIQKSIKTLPRLKPYTWKSVQGCAVIGPDMLWYRGQLLELMGGHVKVQYVDYGLVENIPVVHVYPMLLCVEVPQLCMPCQLLGINPVGGKWQKDGVALMRELLLNRSVDLQVVELPTDPRGPLTVEIFLNGMRLSRILCHNDHASVDTTLSTQKVLTLMPPAPLLDVWDINTEGLRYLEDPVLGSFEQPSLPLEGEHFEVRVTHLCTPNELFLWPLRETADSEMMADSLDEALTRINADITSLPRLTSFPFGGSCLAEYSDGKFYRARLMKFTSIEPLMILVQHVDFGSDDSLPTSKLRQMPAELLKFPPRAIKVKVAGFKAPSIKCREDVLPYCPAWSVKAAMEMTDLLHNKITATVVSPEPELKVQLYDEDGELVHLPLVTSGLAEFD